jgi:hypothetical protein
MDNLENIKKKYDLIGWGLLFVWLGVLTFIPGNQMSLFLAGLGAIILGKSLLLYSFHKAPFEGFFVVVGAIVLIIGLGSEILSLGFPIPIPYFEIALIVIGIILLVRGISAKNVSV